jgi:hypothetical protein
MGKRLVREEARSRLVADARQREARAQARLIAEAEKTKSDVPFVIISDRGAFLTRGRLKELVRQTLGTTSIETDGVRLGAPPSVVVSGFACTEFGLLEEWADGQGAYEGLPGLFEKLCVTTLDPSETDPEVRPLLGVDPIPTGFERRGDAPATVTDWFRHVRTELLTVRPPSGPEFVEVGQVGRVWALGACRNIHLRTL